MTVMEEQGQLRVEDIRLGLPCSSRTSTPPRRGTRMLHRSCERGRGGRTGHVVAPRFLRVGYMAMARLAPAFLVGVGGAGCRSMRVRRAVREVPRMKYGWLRSIHLISGAFAFPVLVMYGVSAVQMAHGRWFDLKPVAVIKHSIHLAAGNDDGRKIAREAMARTDVHGEIETVSTTANGFNVRVTVPGTVHVIEYDRSSGARVCGPPSQGRWAC